MNTRTLTQAELLAEAQARLSWRVAVRMARLSLPVRPRGRWAAVTACTRSYATCDCVNADALYADLGTALHRVSQVQAGLHDLAALQT